MKLLQYKKEYKTVNCKKEPQTSAMEQQKEKQAYRHEQNLGDLWKITTTAKWKHLQHRRHRERERERGKGKTENTQTQEE